MFHMSADKIVRATGAAVVVAGTHDAAGEVVIDSRAVAEGGVFVAFAGEKSDGNRYLAQAIQSGAAVAVASAEPAPEAVEEARVRGAWLLRAEADDCEEFLLRLAAAWRDEHPDWTVVGVTGSVGKTTTKEMLAAGIGAQARCHATRGNFNNLIGLPLTLLSCSDDAEYVVCELGMNHLHEIERLAACARPVVACITNVGTSHIGLLGSRENIARAKAEVVGALEPHGELAPALALMSSGDYYRFIVDGYAAPAGVEVVPCGNHDGDAVRAGDVVLDAEGHPHASIVCADGAEFNVTLSLVGAKAIDDLLLAVALIGKLGLDRACALEAISAMRPTSMRLDVAASPSGIRVIDDSYNAAPSSMAAGLDLLATLACAGKRVAVLGEMGELGDDEVRLHACVGAYAAAKAPDLLVFIGGKLADVYAEAARSVGFSEDALERFNTVEEALAVLGPVFAPGDLVLVKASRSAGLDVFAKGVLAL